MTFELKRKKDITCGKKSTKKSPAYGRGFKPKFFGNSTSGPLPDFSQAVKASQPMSIDGVGDREEEKRLIFEFG